MFLPVYVATVFFFRLSVFFFLSPPTSISCLLLIHTLQNQSFESGGTCIPTQTLQHVSYDISRYTFLKDYSLDRSYVLIYFREKMCYLNRASEILTWDKCMQKGFLKDYMLRNLLRSLHLRESGNV